MLETNFCKLYRDMSPTVLSGYIHVTNCIVWPQACHKLSCLATGMSKTVSPGYRHVTNCIVWLQACHKLSCLVTNMSQTVLSSYRHVTNCLGCRHIKIVLSSSMHATNCLIWLQTCHKLNLTIVVKTKCFASCFLAFDTPTKFVRLCNLSNW